METMQTVIGESHALNTALDHISNLAGIDRSILVTGERGTGKEIAANRLHFLSSRWQGPFIKLNCASLPETLLDSELFGYEPGAFTGARRSHQGRFERADEGTLLDAAPASASRRPRRGLGGGTVGIPISAIVAPTTRGAPPQGLAYIPWPTPTLPTREEALTSIIALYTLCCET